MKVNGFQTQHRSGTNTALVSMSGMYTKANRSYYGNNVLNEMLHCDLEIRSKSLVVKLDSDPVQIHLKFWDCT